MPPLCAHHEEQERHQQRRADLDQEHVAGKHVGLGARRRLHAATLEALEAQRDRAGDDLAHADDAEDGGNGDGADADRLDECFEELVGVHALDGVMMAGVDEVGNLRAEEVDQRPQHQAAEHRPGGDDGGVSEPNDVAEAEERRVPSIDMSSRMDDILSPKLPEQRLGRHHRVPCAHRLDDEVVDGAQAEGHQQHFAGALGRALAGHQNFVDGGCLGEGELAVEVLHEVLAERNDEHGPQEAADGAGQERLPPMHGEPVDVERRDDERGAGGDHAGGLADGLHDDVLEDGALAAAFQPLAAEEDGQDGDGDGGFDGVGRLEGHVDAGGGEHDHHDQARP